MQLLADALVELHVIEAISDETVRQTPGENRPKPWRIARWCIARIGVDFASRMEDVLDLYAGAAPDPARAVVCFDEQPVALRADDFMVRTHSTQAASSRA